MTFHKALTYTACVHHVSLIAGIPAMVLTLTTVKQLGCRACDTVTMAIVKRNTRATVLVSMLGNHKILQVPTDTIGSCCFNYHW